MFFPTLSLFVERSSVGGLCTRQLLLGSVAGSRRLLPSVSVSHVCIFPTRVKIFYRKGTAKEKSHPSRKLAPYQLMSETDSESHQERDKAKCCLLLDSSYIPHWQSQTCSLLVLCQQPPEENATISIHLRGSTGDVFWQVIQGLQRENVP